MMKPYVPKQFDPGRLIYPIEFYQQVTAPDGAGGTTVTLLLSLATKAARVKVNEFDQLALEAGASNLNGDFWYVIRKRNAWYPTKDMLVKINNVEYTIRGIIPLNEPENYTKLLCVRKI